MNCFNLKTSVRISESSGVDGYFCSVFPAKAGIQASSESGHRLSPVRRVNCIFQVNRSQVANHRSQIKNRNLRQKAFLFLFSTFHLLPSTLLHAQTIVKFATLAPDGSTWMKAMKQFAVEVSSKTDNRVKFKFYAGGVSGDEKDVVRKIRLGQLQAGGFTGVGLGEIAPEARLLDTPFLFNNAREIDYIYKFFDADFRKIFESRGYILLGWAEVGAVNIFSNAPIT